MNIHWQQYHYWYSELDYEYVMALPYAAAAHYSISEAIAETSSEWFRIYEPLKWD